jgi:hypothetical protein
LLFVSITFDDALLHDHHAMIDDNDVYVDDTGLGLGSGWGTHITPKKKNQTSRERREGQLSKYMPHFCSSNVSMCVYVKHSLQTNGVSRRQVLTFPWCFIYIVRNALLHKIVQKVKINAVESFDLPRFIASLSKYDLSCVLQQGNAQLLQQGLIRVHRDKLFRKLKRS